MNIGYSLLVDNKVKKCRVNVGLRFADDEVADEVAGVVGRD